jgi:hypothetical protein
MPRPCLYFLLLALSAAAAPARAWGPQGHEIVGDLAARQLRPAARAEVARLLAGEPVPTLAGVANWADELRGTESGPVRTSRLHYVNFKDGCEYVPPRDCPGDQCVVAAINRDFLVLSQRSQPDDARRDALKFLVHFVGDVHQPLHASPRGDHGGNDYQLNYRGRGTNLHAVWDGLILQHAGLPAADYADRLAAQPPLPPDLAGRSGRPAVDWAVESCRIVETGPLYPRGHVIDDAYLDSNRPLVEQRLRRAGARLAYLINDALAPQAH